MKTVDTYRNLAEILAEHAQNNPFKIAYDCDNGTSIESIDYADLQSKAASVARKLLTIARPGDRAVLIYTTSIDFVVAFLACSMSGVIAIPSFPPATALISKKLSLIINDCAPKVVMTTQSLYWYLLGGKFVNTVDTIIQPISKGFLKEHDHVFYSALKSCDLLITDTIKKDPYDLSDLPIVNPDDLLFLQYTSGTTDKAKGVMVSHGAVIQNIFTIIEQMQLKPHMSALCWVPHYHDLGLIAGILTPLFTGYTTRLISPMEIVKSPLKWLQTMSDMKYVISGGPPFGFQLCLKIKDEELQNIDLSSWKYAYCGAEPVPAERMREFTNRFANRGFDRNAFTISYGMAETTLWVTGKVKYNMDDALRVSKSSLFQKQIAEEPKKPLDTIEVVSCGPVPPDHDVQIVDIKTHQILPEAHVGRIIVNSPGLAKGYWNNPDLTRAVFSVDEDGKCYLDTGDLGFFYEGDLYVTGRVKEILILHGVNYNPQSIEQEIEKNIPQLRPGGIAAIQMMGEDLDTISIAAEVKNLNQSELAEIGYRIQESLAKSFSIEVGKVYFVPYRFIPKTTSGKISRYSTMLKLHNESNQIVHVYKPSITTNIIENGIIRDDVLYKELSHLANSFEKKDIASTDLISEVFNDSLKLMQLLIFLETTLKTENLPFSLLHEKQTYDNLITQAIAYAKQTKTDSTASNVSTKASLFVPPLVQLVADVMTDKEFNMAYVCDIHGRLTQAQLEKALSQLVKIQPYLSASYSKERNQFILNDVTSKDLVVAKKIALPQRSVQQFLEETIHDLSTSIDVSKAPLFKTSFVENLSTGNSYLILVISHFVADPYSIMLLFNQLEMLLKSERDTALLAKNIQRELNVLNEIFQGESRMSKHPPVAESQEDTLFIPLDLKAANWINAQKNMDTALIRIASEALKRVGMRTDVIQYLHNGRTLYQDNNPIKNIIAWLNLSWPVKIVDQNITLNERDAIEYTKKTWYNLNDDDSFIDPLNPELEYSNISFHQFKTPGGLFSSSVLFKDNFLHGRTFAEKLPRYRKVFIRPFKKNEEIYLAFYIQKGILDKAKLKMHVEKVLDEYMRGDNV